MQLDDWMIEDGLKFICGTWQVDYLVNAFSNDLSHIPATEWKSDDGTDFSQITYTFTEDHNVVMRSGADGKEVTGTWEQTGMCEYHYTMNEFLTVPDGPFKKNAETLTIQDGALCFSIGFVAVGMKKIEEGVITKEPDVADKTPSAEDEAMNDVVGKYRVYKAMAVIGEGFGLHTEEEVKADLEAKIAEGKADEESAGHSLESFSGMFEFTADHKVIEWFKLPEGVTDEQIKEALESGEIAGYEDGYIITGESAWKAVDGKYYYDTKQHREMAGEVLSSWDEISLDADGCMKYADGLMVLKKI